MSQIVRIGNGDDGRGTNLSSPQIRSRAHLFLRLFLAMAAVGLFLAMVPRGALAEAWHLVRETGPKLGLVLLPVAMGIFLDAAAQSSLFARLSRKATVKLTALARVSAEAVALSTPGGGVLGEPVAALVLARRGGIPLGESVAVCAARRVLLMRMHAAWIVLGVLLGWSLLAARSQSVLGSSWLPFLVFASALLPLSVAATVSVAFASGSIASRVVRTLTRIVPARFQAFIRKGEHQASLADGSATSLLRGGLRSHLGPALLFGGVWLAESCEAYAIVHLLGGSLSFAHIMAIESTASLLRALAFFAPAGLGIQDIGYLALMGGDPHAVVAATGFVIVKRGREALSIAVGLLCLTLSSRKKGASRVITAVEAVPT